MTDRESQTVRLAKELMGWATYDSGLGIYTNLTRGNTTYPHRLAGFGHGPAWDPFTSIADAWMLAEKLRERYCFQVDSVGFDPNIWRCMVGWSDDPISVIADAPTAPEAICRAALKALDMEGQ